MRRYAVVGLGLCLGLAVTSACEDAATQSATQPGEQAWGRPVNGLQAGLDFLGFVGKSKAKVNLRFRLRNAGDKPVRVLRLSVRASFWGENLPLEVKVGSEVLKYRGPVLEPSLPPRPESYVYLAPGEIDSVEVEMNPAHWGVKDPSKATAVFIFTNMNEKEDLGPRWPVITGLWTGTARSAPISLAPGSATRPDAPLASLLNRKWLQLQQELAAKGIVARDVREDSPNVKMPTYILGLAGKGYGNVKVVVNDGVVDEVEVWPGQGLPGFSRKVAGAVEPGQDVAAVVKEHGKPIYEVTGREGQWCRVWKTGDWVVVGSRNISDGNTIKRVHAFHMNRLPPTRRILPYGNSDGLAKLLKELGGKQAPFELDAHLATQPATGRTTSHPQGQPVIALWNDGTHLLNIKPFLLFAAWEDGTVLRRGEVSKPISGAQSIARKLTIGSVKPSEVQALQAAIAKAGFFSPPLGDGLVFVDGPSQSLCVRFGKANRLLSHHGPSDKWLGEYVGTMGPTSGPTREDADAFVAMWDQVAKLIDAATPTSMAEFRGQVELARPEPFDATDENGNPSVAYRGIPEHKEVKSHVGTPQCVTTMTAVKVVEREKYVELKTAGKSRNEERHGDWVYFATSGEVQVPNETASMELTTRYKAQVPVSRSATQPTMQAGK